MELALKTPTATILYTLSHTRRKTIELRVGPDGSVRVTSPYGIDQSQIEQLILAREDWIREKREQLARARALDAQRHELMTGDTLLYHGQMRRLGVYHMPGEAASVMMRDGEICVFAADVSREAVRAALISWYSREALRELEAAVTRYAPIVGVAPAQVSVRDMRSRWGSCSSKGNLSFNWKLVMAPEAILRYVAVHELCHLVELNHSAAFWDLVAAAMPDYAAHLDWLKANGNNLGI